MTQLDTAVTHRWSDLPQDRPIAELARRRIVGQHVMLSEIRLDKGCFVPVHAHENEQMVIILEGRMRFELGEEREVRVVSAGEVLVVPPNVPHGVTAEEDTHVIDVFSPVTEKTGIDVDT